MVKLKKLSFVCFCLTLAVSSGWSAPSVKMLGGGNMLSGTSKAVSVKNNVQKTDSDVVRTGSIRTVKPVSAKTVSDNKSVNDVNTARLSVGKYLHSAGVKEGKIKPINVSNSSVSNAEFDQLDEQVNQLNTQVTELTNHVSELENSIGVEVVEKDANADTNKFINKVEVDENGKTLRVSRSNIQIPVGSEDAAPVASMWIEQ